jgi:hypothetical protein
MKHGAPFDPTWVLTPETDRSPFSDKRTIKARWEGDAIGNDHRLDPDLLPNAVELSVTHLGRNKAFGVFVTCWTIYTDGTMTNMPLTGDVVRIDTVPAARYSHKALGQIAEQALAEFPHNLPAGTRPAEAWERIVAHHATTEQPVLEDDAQDPEFLHDLADAAGLLDGLTADPVSANMPDFEAAIGL